MCREGSDTTESALGPPSPRAHASSRNPMAFRQGTWAGPPVPMAFPGLASHCVPGCVWCWCWCWGATWLTASLPPGVCGVVCCGPLSDSLLNPERAALTSAGLCGYIEPDPVSILIDSAYAAIAQSARKSTRVPYIKDRYSPSSTRIHAHSGPPTVDSGELRTPFRAPEGPL